MQELFDKIRSLSIQMPINLFPFGGIVDPTRKNFGKNTEKITQNGTSKQRNIVIMFNKFPVINKNSVSEKNGLTFFRIIGIMNSVLI